MAGCAPADTRFKIVSPTDFWINALTVEREMRIMRREVLAPLSIFDPLAMIPAYLDAIDQLNDTLFGTLTPSGRF